MDFSFSIAEDVDYSAEETEAVFAKDIFPAETLAVTFSPSRTSPDKIALASAVSNSF